jgi:2-polyprenyl-3-methyl-5-hydroxy-6-metoxy-1,4-benzoquinol methylase
MKVWEGACKSNRDNILKLLEKDEHASLLDLGCGEGTWTLAVAERIGTKEIHGVEIAEDLIEKAVQKGLVVVRSDLNERFPFDSNFFDVVHANQVIEHVVILDSFVEEIYRVLKPGGYVILSTENLSSFDNLLALFLGQQAFSQSISERKVLGNIFSPMYGVTLQERQFTHKIIFTYFGLQQLLKSYNFYIERILTAGYGFLARVDPVHARFMVIKARKKVAS